MLRGAEGFRTQKLADFIIWNFSSRANSAEGLFLSSLCAAAPDASRLNSDGATKVPLQKQLKNRAMKTC